jgi:serine/threonine protein kinase
MVQKGGGQQQTEKAWEIEARALNAINLLEHGHIMTSIAAIRRGDNRYFMFPWAEESLRDYWNATPEQNPTPELILEALNQLRGIADALDQLHNFRGVSPSTNETYHGVRVVVDPPPVDDSTTRMDDDEDLNDYHNPMSQESIRHGDLRPENIFRFLDGRSIIGTLKLGDMGLAKRHVAATRNRRGTSVRYGTLRYESPETRLAGRGRSRLYDLWSMGCITFEFIIWLLYGNNALVNFYNQAGKESAPSDFRYYKMKESAQGPHSIVHPTVVRWMDHIQEHDPEYRRSSTSALKDLLQIVREKLLVVDLPPIRGSALASGGGGRPLPMPEFVGGKTKYRATASEFRRALDKIKGKGQDVTYLFTGQGRYNVSLPSGPSVQTNFLHPTTSYLPTGTRRDDPKTSPKTGPLATGVLSRKIKADYSLPPLEDWEFEVDNVFAERAISHIEAESPTKQSTTIGQLCGRCSTLNFWLSGFAIDHDLNELAESAKTCDLCRLFQNASYGVDRQHGGKLRFERNQSVITMTGHSFPVLSIFRSPGLYILIRFPNLITI